MFTSLRIRGGRASLLWGHRPVAVLKSWSIAKRKGQWELNGALERVDAFQVRQRPLLFTAPREGTRDGFWAWPIIDVRVGPNQLRATLGQPEQ